MKYPFTPVVLSLMLVFLFCLYGCGAKDMPAETAAVAPASVAQEPKQRLDITFDIGDNQSSIDLKEWGLNYPCDFDLEGLQNVQIQMDGVYYPLEEALKEGKVTPEELVAYAQIDARTGFCTEKYETRNGLTRFTYVYPDFKLNYIHCVYETPDGNSYELWEYALLSPNFVPTLPIPTDDEGLDLDREDWGVTLTITEATPTELTVETSQSGGMQFGTLSVEDYYVIAWEGSQIVDGTWRMRQDIPITMEGSGEFTASWEPTLAPGEYMFVARLREVYDPADVPPLMKNYHDHQQYAVPFTITEAK